MLDREPERAETIWPGLELLNAYVALRYWCVRAGHALGQKLHGADRWVAATVARMRAHPATQAYAQRRRAEGKTDREIHRCIKRYLARHLYRVLTSQANPCPQVT